MGLFCSSKLKLRTKTVKCVYCGEVSLCRGLSGSFYPGYYKGELDDVLSWQCKKCELASNIKDKKIIIEKERVEAERQKSWRKERDKLLKSK